MSWYFRPLLYRVRLIDRSFFVFRFVCPACLVLPVVLVLFFLLVLIFVENGDHYSVESYSVEPYG